MREIKFRFCDYQGRWHYWSLGQPQPDFDSGDITSLGQYTGLKDRLGVDVYEGDVVGFRNRHNIRARVNYNPHTGFGLVWDLSTAKTRRETRLDRLPSNLNLVWEVIGNCFENADLEVATPFDTDAKFQVFCGLQS